MKIFQVTFSFLDPSKAMGTVMADTPEEAIEKIKNDLAENSPGVEAFEVISVEEVLSTKTPAEDLSEDRTLN